MLFKKFNFVFNWVEPEDFKRVQDLKKIIKKILKDFDRGRNTS